jgi:hypothetical protein
MAWTSCPPPIRRRAEIIVRVQATPTIVLQPLVTHDQPVKYRRPAPLAAGQSVYGEQTRGMGEDLEDAGLRFGFGWCAKNHNPACSLSQIARCKQPFLDNLYGRKLRDAIETMVLKRAEG